MNPTVLHIPDMTCGHCARTITQAVQRLDPAARVDCNLPEHTVQIDSTVPEETLRRTLADEGYPAR